MMDKSKFFVLTLAMLMTSPVFSQKCGANLAPAVWKDFMCYNLGVANDKADPFTPSWEIIGGYWQWGRVLMAVSGPTGSSVSQDKSTCDWTWPTTYKFKSSWSDDTITVDEPCPPGYRIPTKWQWNSIIKHNELRRVGTWSSYSTNYSSALFIGDKLMLPAAGLRDSGNGELKSRGLFGFYWSSTKGDQISSWNLFFDKNSEKTMRTNFPTGCSVRCIAE